MTDIITKPKGTKDVLSFYGGCEEFLESTDHQNILYGGTGSGKTVTVCTKVFMLSLLYPGVKSLITRNSYVALVKSALSTFEMVVEKMGWSIGKKPGPKIIVRLGESKPTEYCFPYAKRVVKLEDGTERIYEGQSRILVASLSNVKDELGAEYDYVYLNQPELSTEEDWQFLVTRANGRRGHAPYPQLFGDPNPENERHWIWKGGFGEGVDEFGNYQRLGLGPDGEDTRWRLIKSVYTDNPTIWDHKLNCFTVEGEKMMDRLRKSLNPVMAERLIKGEWCSFEGLVFGEVLSREKHLRPRHEFDITDDWDRYLAIDFGFTDPFVCMWLAKNPHKEQYVCYRYICMSNETIMTHIDTIKNYMYGEPKPKLIVADRDPESILIMERGLGMSIIQAKKGAESIIAGINVLTDMLKNDQLIFLEDSCVEEDMVMRQGKKPIGFIEEAENYRWDLAKVDEKPIGGDDHCIDALRYVFLHIKANQKIIPFIWL